VTSIGTDVLTHLGEELINTDAYTADISGVSTAVQDVAAEFGPGFTDTALLAEAERHSLRRVEKVQALYSQTVSRCGAPITGTLLMVVYRSPMF
jgi:hypothetical protein